MRSKDQILLEELYLQILREDNGKNPFQNSKVQDIVWRIGDDLDKLHPDTSGIWFAENKQDVEKFAKTFDDRFSKMQGRPYYINLENPKLLDGFWNDYIPKTEQYLFQNGMSMRYDIRNARKDYHNFLIKQGHDGIIIDTDTWNDTANQETSVTSKQYVVFDPKNIKLIQNEI